jgi:thiamine-phosphate pyrophosphorylase
VSVAPALAKAADFAQARLMRFECRLYLITPPVIDDGARFAALLDEALDGGDVAALQIRLKSAAGPAPDDHVLAVSRALMPVAHARGIAVLMNDRADLAKAAGCDGVHLGQGDGSVQAARRLLGERAMIGVTCHDSRHLAMEAAESGADYVAFGAFFDSGTKQASHRAEPEILDIWQSTMEVPCVAIGGITHDNAGALARAGADFVAVSGGVWNHAHGPRAAIAAINAAIAEGSAARTAS